MQLNKIIFFFTTFSILLCEIVFVGYNPDLGLGLYAAFLTAIIFALLAKNLPERETKLLKALTILPLIRLVGFLVPFTQAEFLTRALVIYGIIFVGIWFMLPNLGLNLGKIGLKLPSKKWLLASTALAIVLGLVEFAIIRPKPLAESFTLNFAITGFLLIMFLGFSEEIIFRGTIQRLSMRLYKYSTVLIFSNLLFAIMHLIWVNPFDTIFVFAVGVFLGIIYQRTGNLTVVSLIHGILNFFLFIVYPFLFAMPNWAL